MHLPSVSRLWSCMRNFIVGWKTAATAPVSLIIRNGSFDWFRVYDEYDRVMAEVQPFRKDGKLGVIGAYNTDIREWTIEAKQKKRQCSFPILRPRARSALIAAIWISFPDRQSIKPALNVGQERVMKKLCEGGILTSL
jgi:hypothetical protein